MTNAHPTLRTPRRARAALAAAIVPLASAAGVTAQSPGPLTNLVISGYGTMAYDASTTEEFQNDFTTSLSPVLLYSHGSDLLFEAELEFGLSGETTTTTLEYAQIDYLGFENFQFVGGKFLLPFGLFGERFHPTWINKLPTMPLVFGHAHGGVPEGSLLPILSDAGLIARYCRELGGKWALDVSGYVTQGPVLVDPSAEPADAHGAVVAAQTFADPLHDAEPSPGTSSFGAVPSVGFGVGFDDNNKNKMVGGRVGFVNASAFEVHLSAFHAMYDPESFLDYQGFAASVQTRVRGLELLGEGVLLRQEFEVGEGAFDFQESPGYYMQASWRAGAFEPVARWSQLLDAKVGGVTTRGSAEEFMFGVNYWVSNTVPVKLAYGVNPDRDDRFYFMWAFGF